MIKLKFVSHVITILYRKVRNKSCNYKYKNKLKRK